MDQDFYIGMLLGSALTLLLGAVLVDKARPSDKDTFTQRCQSDNGVAIFADKEYCIKRSAFVETVR